jgi:hypothetical protein
MFFFKIFFSLLLFVLGWVLLSNAHGWKDLLSICGGAFLIMSPAFVFGPKLAGFASTFVNGIFYPGRHDRHIGYSIPEALRIQGKFDEAIKKYEDMILEFPFETEPYIRIMQIAVYDLKNMRIAENIYRKGLRTVKSEKQKSLLTNAYKELSR